LRYKNKLGINLFNNVLKRDPKFLVEKNSLEAVWYDAEAQNCIGQLKSDPGQMPMDRDFEEWFAAFVDIPRQYRAFDKESVFFNAFPDVKGLRILELGFGNGCLSRFFLRRGAEVISIDLSRVYGKFLRQSHSESLPLVSCAEILPFKDKSFDIVTAFVSLHHFNLDLCLAEIHRVLIDNGQGVFIEPLSDSRLLYKLRQIIPVTDNESPGGGGLQSSELKNKLTSVGFDYSIQKFELISRLERLPFCSRFQNQLRRLDYFLLRFFPFLSRFARNIVIVIKKCEKK
jgi:SAM-dependent methyltransferase